MGRHAIECNGDAVGQGHNAYNAIVMVDSFVIHNHYALWRRLRTMLLWIILMV